MSERSERIIEQVVPERSERIIEQVVPERSERIIEQVVLPNRAAQFELAPAELADRWAKYGKWDRPYFPSLVGMEIEEVRLDYCRMRLPFKESLEQPAGVMHGGAIATLLDSVVVPAVGCRYTAEARMSTVDMHVQYMSAVIRDDLVAEGWIVRRGRTVVFCESEARAASTGKLVARSVLTFNVSIP